MEHVKTRVFRVVFGERFVRSLYHDFYREINIGAYPSWLSWLTDVNFFSPLSEIIQANAPTGLVHTITSSSKSGMRVYSQDFAIRHSIHFRSREQSDVRCLLLFMHCELFHAIQKILLLIFSFLLYFIIVIFYFFINRILCC